ncbi:MAG: dolichol monophosphate mannose synthase [Armatimonadota bacterium]
MNQTPSSTRIPAQENRAFDLSIVVGTIDEEKNIPVLYASLNKVLEGIHWELVVVDDDSRDGTPDLLVQMNREHPNVRFIRRIGRIGLSTAVIEGIMSCASPIIAVMDADGQHDETVLPAMVAKIRDEGFDIAVGSRYVPGGSVENWPEERLKMSLTANRIAKNLYGVPLADSGGNFFAIRRQVFERVVRRLSGRGFKLLFDILLLSPPETKIIELPIKFSTRKVGDSKLSDFVKVEYGLQLWDHKFGRILPARVLLDLSLVAGFSIVAAVIANILYQVLRVPPGGSLVLATLPILYLTHTLALRFMPGRKRPKGSARWRDLAQFVLVCLPFLLLGFWLATSLVPSGKMFLRTFFACACAVSTGVLLATNWRKEAAARR